MVRVAPIVNSALLHDEQARAALVAEACGNDVDLAQQYFIALTGVCQKRPALLGTVCERGITEIRNLPPAVR